MLMDLDYIRTKFRRACQILELNEPILKFEQNNQRSSRYTEWNNEITINITDLGYLKISVLPFIKIKLKKDIDIIMFSVYHELGHCLQWTKFEKWFITCKSEWLDFEAHIAGGITIGKEDFKKYRELKLEKYADKIAFILFKKLETNRY